MTLIELQTKRDALLTAMTQAILSLQKGDKSITYQTISEMKKALVIIDGEIVSVGGTSRVSRGRFLTPD
jgi:hypothetical protein